MIGASKTARAILDVHIIGDDLICTNSVLLQKAIAEKALNLETGEEVKEMVQSKIAELGIKIV